MKTEVKIKYDDQQYYEYKAGEDGYIDGYVQGGNGAPYACVVIEDRVVLVPLNCLEITGLTQ